jgi:hypothetical protein
MAANAALSAGVISAVFPISLRTNLATMFSSVNYVYF